MFAFRYTVVCATHCVHVLSLMLFIVRTARYTLSFRASEPEELVTLQRKHWEPVLSWFNDRCAYSIWCYVVCELPSVAMALIYLCCHSNDNFPLQHDYLIQTQLPPFLLRYDGDLQATETLAPLEPSQPLREALSQYMLGLGCWGLAG